VEGVIGSGNKNGAERDSAAEKCGDQPDADPVDIWLNWQEGGRYGRHTRACPQFLHTKFPPDVRDGGRLANGLGRQLSHLADSKGHTHLGAREHF
jgi:hypothetical protein